VNWSPGAGKERIGSRSKIEGTLDEDPMRDKEKERGKRIEWRSGDSQRRSDFVPEARH